MLNFERSSLSQKLSLMSLLATGTALDDAQQPTTLIPGYTCS